MKKRKALVPALAVATALSLSCAVLGTGAAAGTLPGRAEVKQGVSVYANDKGEVDASNLAEGYLFLRYTGGKNVRIKAQIIKEGGVTYTYDLNNAGQRETYPLTEGNGNYTVKILENTTGNRYAQAYACTLELTLRDPMAPFLYSNQFVNYTADSATAAKAAQLTGGVEGTVGKVAAVFDYVVDHFTYDSAQAATVQSGYLPNVDQVLAEQKGICFDYAAVMTAMLRSQNIPCKLVVGYAGTIYHAWIDVYVEGTGWIAGAIRFDGKDWTLMDPTFVSSGKRSPSIMEYVTTDSNYSQKYAY